MLFVHGSGGHHAAWWQQTPYFSTRGYSVVTLDLRGFGRSTSELDEYDSLEFPGDILAVLDDAGIEKAVLVGQSIGASAALKVAVAHPDRVAGVVLAHSLGGLDNPELAELVKADRAEAEKLPVLDRLMSKSFQESSPELTFLFRQMGTFNKRQDAGPAQPHRRRPDARDARPGSDVPICFLAGENDAVIRPATSAARTSWSRARCSSWSRTGRTPCTGRRPDLFNAGGRALPQDRLRLSAA